MADKASTPRAGDVSAWSLVFLVAGLIGLGALNLYLFHAQFGHGRAVSRSGVLASAPKQAAVAPTPVKAEVPLAAPTQAAKEEKPAPPPPALPSAERPMDPLEQDAIPFPSGSAELDPSLTPRLKAFAEYLKAARGATVVVTGFAPEGESRRKAKYLARQRARSVREKLVSEGLSRHRIIIRDVVVPKNEGRVDILTHHAKIEIRTPKGDGR